MFERPTDARPGDVSTRGRGSVSRRPHRTGAGAPGTVTEDEVTSLQRAAGNAAVTALLTQAPSVTQAARGDQVMVTRVGQLSSSSANPATIQRTSVDDTISSEPASESDRAAADAAAAESAQRGLMRADAAFIAAYVRNLDINSDLKIDQDAATLVVTKFNAWNQLHLLHDFVAELRKLEVGGILAGLLDSRNAWSYLVAVLPKPHRTRLYDLLAEGNVSARNAGRFTEEIIEFWETEMDRDANRVYVSYRSLASTEDDTRGAVAKAVAGSEIIARFGEYRALDERYGMKGTLLSKFVLKCDRTVEVDAFLGTSWITQQTRMLDDIKRRLSSGPRSSFMAVLQASNLEVLKGDAPELLSVGGEIKSQVIESVAELVNSVDDLIEYIGEYAKEQVEDAIRVLAESPSKIQILLDFVADYFQAFPTLAGTALGYLSGKNIVYIIKKIDPVRLGEFYLAMVTLVGSAMFLPQLFAAYWLLPTDLRNKVFSSLGRTEFVPIIREAKAFIVPVLRDLINDKLPVNTGVYFERGLSASARIAQAGGDSSFSIIRIDPDNFLYNERYALRGGVGVSAGIGKTEGKKQGDKDNQVFWGHEASANAAALGHMITQNTYKFPIMNDDAFVGFLAAFVDVEAAVSLGAFVFDELKDIDPLPYLKKAKFEHKLEGSAAGVAKSGLREGKGGADDTHRWGSHRPEGESKPEEMGSSKWSMFGAEAGATVSVLAEAGASLEIEADKGKHDVSLQLGAKRAAGLGINLPGLGILSRAVPANLDAGVAVKLTTTISGLASQNPAREGSWKLSVVGTSGELDVYQGSGMEAEVELPDIGSVHDVDSFIDSLGEAKFKSRLGLASGLGSKMLSALDNQINLSSQLKKEYGYGGIKVKGAFDVEFELSDSDVRRIARTIYELIAQIAASDDLLGQLQRAVTTFLTTGALPKSATEAGKTIGAVLLASVKKGIYHVEIGYARAMGRELFGDKGAGGKGGVGAHGYIGAGGIYHGEIEDPLAGINPGDVIDVLRGAGKAIGGLETVIDVS